MDTRITLGEQIQEYIYGNSDRSRDEKLDIREVYAHMDQVANSFARIGRLERMKENVFGVDSCYMTLFPGIKVEKFTDNTSQVKLPSTFMQLSHNRGIVIRPAGSFEDKFIPVVNNFAGTSKYLLGGNLEGRIGYMINYRSDGPYVVFVKKVHEGDDHVDAVDIQLAIVDSSVIDDNAPYPIDPQWTKDFIKEVAGFFLPKTQIPTDEVNDAVTKPENK